MLTPFQLQKQQHYFNVLDADRNGYIEQADFEEIGRLFATALGLQPGEAMYDQFCYGILELWRQMQPEADTNTDGRISFDEFLRFEQRKIFDATPEEFDAYVGATTRGLTAIADRDGDGYLDVDEWRTFFHGFRMDESKVEESFKHLDLNDDGKLSAEEQIAAIHEFHFSDDPNAPGNWVFGPLTA